MGKSFNGKEVLNTFNKGMDLDSDVLSVSNDSYIYAENVRIIVDDTSNKGSLHAVEGFKKLNLSLLQFGYYEHNIETDEDILKYDSFDPDFYKIIGIGVIRDYVCLITKDNNEKNSIFRLKIKDENVDLFKIVTGDFNIGGENSNQLSIVTKWEDYDNIKIYWADGVNPLRSINISEGKDLDNYNKTSNFFDNIISITLSKPIFDSFVSGNLKPGMIQYAYVMFDKNGSKTNISPLTDVIHLTKYNAFDLEYKGSKKEENSGKSCKIKFEITDDKFSKCKIFRIHHIDDSELPKIYLAFEGDLSPVVENGKHIQYFTDNEASLNEITFEEFVGSDPYYFIPKVLESKDNILFAANIIESNWDKNIESFNFDTRVFRFAYNKENGYHTKLDSINNSYKILKYEDIKDTSDEEWLKLLPNDHDCINPINYIYSDDLKRDESSYEWYYDGTNKLEYKGGIGRNISYKIIHTKFGEDYYEENRLSNSEWVNERSKRHGYVERAVLEKKGSVDENIIPIHYKIPEPNSKKYEEPDYEYKTDVNFKNLGILNYSNPYLNYKFRSYQRDEVYRFGVVFYNKFGQSSPVSWIGDIRMPSSKEYDHRIFEQWGRIKKNIDGDYNVHQVITHPMGIEFTISNIPEDISYIEIVRSERKRENRRILYQGLIGRALKKEGSLRPMNILTYTDNIQCNVWVNDHRHSISSEYINITPYMDSAKGYFTFISPELCYFDKDSQEISKNIKYIEILNGVSSPTDIMKTAADIGRSVFKDIVEDDAPYDRKKRKQQYTRGYGAIYNSRYYFDKHNVPTVNLLVGGAIDNADSIQYIDGFVGRYNLKPGERIVNSTGYNTMNMSDDTQLDGEDQSTYISKLYTLFNKYNKNVPINEYNSIFNVTSSVYATGLDLFDYEDVVQGLKTIPFNGNNYQNWSLDRKLLDKSNKIKHGPYSPCLVLNSDLDLPYIKEIGFDEIDKIEYSSYNNKKSFDLRYKRIEHNWDRGYIGLINSYDRAVAYAANATFFVNLCQIPNKYGGDDYNSRTNTQYISTGVIIQNDNSIKKDIVFGGDTFINIQEQILQHWYYLKSDPKPGIGAAKEKRGERAQIILMYPCETSINLSMINGDTFTRYSNITYLDKTYGDGSSGHQDDGKYKANAYPHNIQLQPGVVMPDNEFTQTDPLYSYNSVYSSSGKSNIFLPKGVYTEDNKNYDYRVMYSDQKTLDEISDNWLNFKPASYLDVDTRFGSINNIKLFKNNLYFWQDDSFGVLSVNQRSLISDNNVGGLLLGTGDLLSRYDYISTEYGSKKDVINNVVNTNSSLYWYDHDRAEMLSFNNVLTPLSKIKNVQSFFNKNKDVITDYIITLNNRKFNEVNFLFRDIKGGYNNLVFNEQINGFSSFHTYEPDWYIDLKDNVYNIKNNNIYLMNKGDYNDFYNNDELTRVDFVVNENPINTKVYDNVETTGLIPLNDLFSNKYFTKSQESLTIYKDDVEIREDNYRYNVPRTKELIKTGSELFPEQRDRMRGKFLISSYNFKPENDDLNVPYIKTSYRISNI